MQVMGPAIQTVADSVAIPDYVLDEEPGASQFQARPATYLDVIKANAPYHQSTINALEAAAARYQDKAALIAALGGGWSKTDAG